MLKKSNKYVLLSVLVIFAFAYRMMFIHWQMFPPGADIGLHNSVVHSIMVPGKTDFLWNYYQMGGGVSLTFPGYHIFVSQILLITGMPDYLVHSLVASVFSSLIVLCAYLLARIVGGESVGFIVAFLVAISRFDIEMLLWGGYPNVVTLMLIPLTFYIFLQKDKFSLQSFLTVTTVLSGAIFLTHSLSSIIFVFVTFATIVSVAIFSNRIRVAKTHVLVWFLPLFLGAIIVSPFLLNVVPAYLSENADISMGAASAIRLALISTRILPLEIIVPLLVCFPLFFLFSWKYKRNLFSLPAVLFAVWVLIPTVSTQGFLVGLFIDYNRFLYFVTLPVIILIAFGIDHGARFFTDVAHIYLSSLKTSSGGSGGKKIASRLVPHLTNRNIYSVLALVFLLFSFLAVPIFLTPQQGADISSFYQVMTGAGYEGIQWIRTQTPVGSLWVSDAHYGWWLSGFAQRPTFSAVHPQYLTLTREFEPAKTAVSLLDADYIVDNGLIQVREDGGYIGRHNPSFLAKIYNVYEPYPFFHFNNSEITVFCRKDGVVESFDLPQVPLKEMRIDADSEYVTIFMRRENQRFNFTQETTVYRGVRFVNMSATVKSDVEGVSIDWVQFVMHTKGAAMQNDKTVALIDQNMRVLGQLIFTEGRPKVFTITTENPSALELRYNLEGKPSGEVELFVGVYQLGFEEIKADCVDKIVADNLVSYMDVVADLPFDVFDYQHVLQENDISYIACRDSDVIAKFAEDPVFSLVFINDDVAVFSVKRGFSQLGRKPLP